MLKLSEQYLIAGGTIDVTWSFNSELKNIYLWYPISWLPWKNFTRINSAGKMALLVSKNGFILEIKQLHFWGFKTLQKINRKVYTIGTKNIETKLSLIENPTIINNEKHNAEIASLSLNRKIKNANPKVKNINTKIKLPSIKNILPIN